jgi:esterase/lipase superfamily enzyme
MLLAAAALCVSSGVRAQSTEEFTALQAFGERMAASEFAVARVQGEALVARLGADVPAEIRADLLTQLVEAQAATGAAPEANVSWAAALPLREQLAGVDSPDLVPVLERGAQLLAAVQRFDEALALLERARLIGERAGGEGHASVLATLELRRSILLQAGRDDAAEQTAQLIETRSQRSRATPLTRMDRKTERRYLAEQGAATVRVYYGTNRKPSGDTRPERFYGKERGELQYGYVDVSIPEIHQEGELETQSRWSLLTYFAQGTDARRRYVLLQKVAPLPADRFAQALRQDIGAQRLKDVFVFVHGFNSSFEDAARRTAQLAYDLDFDGVPMFFSWPSQASTTAYTVDEAAVNVSGRRMAEFLDRVVQESGAQRVHLIAHSMGNRALIEALQTYLAKRKPDERHDLFGQVIFTAPDVDRDYFVEAVDALRPAAVRTTLYASNNDLALKTSQKIHGAPRAGLAGSGIIALPGIDTIDMSGIEADLLGHSYFAVNSGAIYDLFRLLWRSDPPPRRCGLGDTGGAGHPVWRFDSTQCAGPDLLQAGVLAKRFGDRARNRVRARLQQLTDPAQKQEWNRILERLNDLLPGVP